MTKAPTLAIMQGVSGTEHPKSIQGDYFTDPFAYQTCFNTAPIDRRRRRMPSTAAPIASPRSVESSPSPPETALPPNMMNHRSLKLSTGPQCQTPPPVQKNAKRQAAAPAARLTIKTSADLTNHFRNYVRALNTRTIDLVGQYLAKKMMHNGVRVTPAEYCHLIPPAAVFMPEDIIVDLPNRTAAARLYIEFPGDKDYYLNLWGMPNAHTSLTADATTTPEGEAQSRSSRRLAQADAMVFYRYDDNWMIEDVRSMIAPRNNERRRSRSRSPSEFSFRERHDSKSSG